MTPKITPGPELAWDHAAEDIPKTGLAARRSASLEELARVATSLDLASCRVLQADYRIDPSAGGRYRLSGRLHAGVTQMCVVTLDPIDSTIEEDFVAVFWPEEELPEPESGEVAIDEEGEREPIIAGRIGVGRVVFESLAAALDPFPRKPDAVLDWQPPASQEGEGGKPDSPFSVLANLKTKS
jgi:uncharacterized metal-binding protein YceD (DUF177 family)